MKVILLLLISLLISGCLTANENEFNIYNRASAGITINFRSKDYIIPAGGNIKVTDIPNGTFTYNTIYQIPANVTDWSFDGDDGAGEIVFTYRNTQHLLIFTSVTACDDPADISTCEYTVFATRTSTLSHGGSSLISPE